MDKGEFDAALKKLLAAPAIPKKDMAKRLKANSRRLPPLNLPKSPAQ